MADDLSGSGIDHHQLILLVHSDDNMSRAGIIDRVSGAAVKRDAPDQRIRCRIDYRIRITVLVRHKHPLRSGRVSNSIWISNWADASDRFQGLHVYDRDFVLSGSGSVNPAQLRHGPHTMNPGKAVEVGYNFARFYIEHHELIGIHVGDVQPTRGRI